MATIDLQNDLILLRMEDDGSSVQLVDLKRDSEWRLLPSEIRCCGGGSSALRLPAARAYKHGDRISVVYPVDGGTIRLAWTLRSDRVAVTVECDSPEVTSISLPGAFVPTSGPRQIAVPLYQGVLIRGDGAHWQRSVGHGGHSQFSMAMAATIGERGALLLAHESPANWQGTYGVAEDGPFVYFEHHRCPVDGWADATVLLCPCEPNVTSACKRYRALVKERGEFVHWAEKIAAKPALQSLFGALMAFTGYNRADEVDYVACARKLKAQGFHSVFYYPVRMCHYSLGFRMGGDQPVWLSDDQIHALQGIEGVHVGPWAWVFEGMDDSSESMGRIFRHDSNGPVANWRMDDNQWYSVCTPYQIEHIRQRLADDMAAMDWLHFDVNASVSPRTCLSPEHALHGNRPLGAIGDANHTLKLFDVSTVGNRIVSSEGFSDFYAASYDIGTTKILPPETPNGCIPIPMTMLVFHDSCVHDWWELHNYNANPAFPLQPAPNGIGRAGSGEPHLKAAMDALYGCPPNLFPFGRQYGWVREPGGETYSFAVRLEDASVQEAISAALPVAELHRRIGRCEMVGFELLSPDGTLQATTFSDGTGIVADLSGDRLANGQAWYLMDAQAAGR